MSEPTPLQVEQRTSSSAHAEGGAMDAPQDPCRHWVRIVGRYDDRWRTPMAGAPFRLLINGGVVLEREYLKDYEDVGLTRGVPPQGAEQEEAYAELGTFRHRNCDEGDAQAIYIPDPEAESEADELREAITARLDGGYRHLKEKMKPFREQWDQYGYLSVHIASSEGFIDSAVEWGGDIADTAGSAWDKATSADWWRGVGEAIEEGFWEGVDIAEEWAGDAADLAEHAWDNRGVLLDDAWWAERADDAVDFARATAEDVEEVARDAAAFAERTARQAAAIIEHREAILALPGHIVAGRVDDIEAFIDTALADIDPEMANQLRYDSRWQGSIELLHDGETAAQLGVYLSLFLTVAPPNFWAYMQGRAGFYVFVEVVLIVIGALLGGAGAAARIGMISAKLARMGGAAARIGRVADKAMDAGRAAARMLDAFADSLTDVEKLKDKLLKSRRRRARRDGSTNSTLEQRRRTEERDGRCRVCGNTGHNTPIDRRGQVDYV